jgi:hypothetical protein
MVHGVIRNDGSSAVGLADGDLENEHGNRDQNDCHQIWNEPLQAIVVVDLGRVSDQITHTGATAHGSKQETCATRPLISTICGSSRWWRKPPANLLEGVHDRHCRDDVCDVFTP